MQNVSQGFGIGGKSYYGNLSKTCDVNLNFIVDPANGNGLGVRSVKSNGYVANVFMHTTAPLTGSGNPNPAAGYLMVQFRNNFNKYIGGFAGVIPPLGASGVTSTTAGLPYVITSLGTTTLAQFQANGLPAGLTPTVGQTYIATATGALGGTGTLGTAGTSTVSGLAIIGDPNQTIANSQNSQNGGAIVILEFLSSSLANVTPATGSVVGMTFRFDGSNVTVDGL